MPLFRILVLNWNTELRIGITKFCRLTQSFLLCIKSVSSSTVALRKSIFALSELRYQTHVLARSLSKFSPNSEVVYIVQDLSRFSIRYDKNFIIE